MLNSRSKIIYIHVMTEHRLVDYINTAIANIIIKRLLDLIYTVVISHYSSGKTEHLHISMHQKKPILK